MEELLKKKYKLSVEFFGRFKRSKKIDFIFRQGNLRELLEMKEELDEPEKIKKWLFDFLMKKTEKSDKITQGLFDQLSIEEINSIIDFLLRTYGKGFFIKVKKQENEEKESMKKSPTSSMICIILEKTNETVESLMEMTWEQIEYLVQGITWNMNEQTKEGKRKNEMALRMKDLKEGTNGYEEKVKRLEEKMRLSKLKK